MANNQLNRIHIETVLTEPKKRFQKCYCFPCFAVRNHRQKIHKSMYRPRKEMRYSWSLLTVNINVFSAARSEANFVISVTLYRITLWTLTVFQSFFILFLATSIFLIYRFIGYTVPTLVRSFK